MGVGQLWKGLLGSGAFSPPDAVMHDRSCAKGSVVLLLAGSSVYAVDSSTCIRCCMQQEVDTCHHLGENGRHM